MERKDPKNEQSDISIGNRYRTISGSRWLGVRYRPSPEDLSFIERAEVQHDEELSVSVSVLDDRESDRFFGIPSVLGLLGFNGSIFIPSFS